MTEGNAGELLQEIEVEMGGIRAFQSSSVGLSVDRSIFLEQPIVSPAELLQTFPAGEQVADLVAESRRHIANILAGKDQRLLVVVGPCSIHDYDSALEYAERLKHLSVALSEKMLLVMRCYFEKPRTAVGWKGLINDPHLDGSHDIQAGLTLARRILLDINALGVPVATEALDPNLSGYYEDLVSWTAIGARTAESQLHRQFASGLPSPVGIKNTTNGCIDTAINALIAARAKHHFLAVNQEGRLSRIETVGNSSSHIILRGGSGGPNYDADNLRSCKEALSRVGVDARIMIDCSHANSGKRADRQAVVLENLFGQMRAGEAAIAGFMLESHINAGRQDLTVGRDSLAYGVSVTDECIGWEETENLLLTWQ